METEVVFHPDAHQEYLDALQHYMNISERVARRFQKSVIDAVRLISTGPEQWPSVEGAIRFVRLRRFPFIRYYEPVTSDCVQVLAVAHGRRRPGYWVHRQPD
ncbi:MAG: type II toxin-antitoxin system RelE/ParE family toxin [Planctomycetaceae bacterium]|nr:type II toxin-antitoxin system RelE/ParE family toxin [Planctomycetales bacterium]MCB9873160.1 type II toxin-antitoxin system RelE/ParE family toxin [Planctomycetaceae bacterium]MCB9937840.1 type II toxin-antitoxin system RelE/ParE family toxin [Planctomycetaceae bacterium]HRX81402.1 type II toxin-antitoxin system RelE/ParE family toxin [Pirellulaceae bacterium]